MVLEEKTSCYIDEVRYLVFNKSFSLEFNNHIASGVDESVSCMLFAIDIILMANSVIQMSNFR